MWKKLCFCCVGAEATPGPATAEPTASAEPAIEPAVAPREEPDVLIAHVIHAMLEEPIMQIVAEKLQDQVPSMAFPQALGDEIQNLDKYPVAVDIARIIAEGATPQNVAQARALTVQLAREIVDNVLATTPISVNGDATPRIEELPAVNVAREADADTSEEVSTEKTTSEEPESIQVEEVPAATSVEVVEEKEVPAAPEEVAVSVEEEVAGSDDTDTASIEEPAGSLAAEAALEVVAEECSCGECSSAESSSESAEVVYGDSSSATQGASDASDHHE